MKARIKEHKDLSEKRKKISSITDQIADQAVEQIWNETIKHTKQFYPLTGDEILSIYCTLVARMNVHFILSMRDGIVAKDDTGHTIQDLQNYIFDGISHAINTVNKGRETPKTDLGEIKRL